MAIICAKCDNVHETYEDCGLRRYTESQPLMYDRGYVDVGVVEYVCDLCGSNDLYEDSAQKCEDCGYIGQNFPETGAGDACCPDCGHDWIEEI